MKIAILFRGPVRPSPNSVVDRYREFISHFKNINVEIATYLATWRTWKEHKASGLLALDLFDNVIMQTPPTEAHWARCTPIKKLPNGADIEPVFKMYYQSKTALDVIVNADTYNYIIHTRTDIQMILNQYIGQWFDPEHYVAPHVHAEPFTKQLTPFMNDQFGIAPGELMHKAWNYGDIANLGRLIGLADKPEAILQRMIDEAGIKVKTAPYQIWKLDPLRNK